MPGPQVAREHPAFASAGKKSQKEEARRAVRRRAGRKHQGRRREFQTGGFSVISFRR
jgi:hypothetical protein